MNKEIKLKEVKMENLEDLRSIGIETFIDTFKDDNTEEDLSEYLERAFNKKRLKEELSNENSYFYFILENDEIAGYLKLNILSAQTEDMGNDSMEVERIYIRSKFKRKGYGKIFIEKAIELAREKNKASIWLGVWEKNLKAIAFYESLGFVKKSSHSFFMGEDEQTDYIMRKDLSI